MSKLSYHPSGNARYQGDQFCNCGSGKIRYQLTINGNFYGWACCKCEPAKIAKVDQELKSYWMKPIKKLNS